MASYQGLYAKFVSMMFPKSLIVENDGELMLMALHAHFMPQRQYSTPQPTSEEETVHPFDTPKRVKKDPKYAVRKFLEDNMDSFSEDVKIFITAQFLHVPNAPWSQQLRGFAKKLFYKSPSSYAFLVDLGFKLPSVSTIYRWHSEIRLPTGVSDIIVQVLTNKAKMMDSMNKKCVLLFDEMAIKRELESSIKDDIVYGVTDFGKYGRSNIIASKVMVFTLRGLNQNWKQTIAYFVGSPKSDILAKLIVDIVEEVNNCGMEIVATCCDQGTSNFSAYNMLMKENPEPWVEIGNRKIFLLYDYAHMSKSVRNVLLKNKISFDNEVVDWKVLDTVFEMDSKNQSFRLLPKISKEHVHPDGFQKLSVKRATQVFSESVSTGIKCAILSGVFKTDEEKETAESTANLFCRLNVLFDKLNTGQLYSRNPNQKVLSDSTSTLNDLREARHWIETWKSSGKYSRPPLWLQLLNQLDFVWRTKVFMQNSSQ